MAKDSGRAAADLAGLPHSLDEEEENLQQVVRRALLCF